MNCLANTIPLCGSDEPQMSAIRIGRAADADGFNLLRDLHNDMGFIGYLILFKENLIGRLFC